MAVRHKHLKIEQTKLDRARRILAAKTEQETVDRALDQILAEDEIIRGLRRLGATAGEGLEDPFAKR